MASNLQYSMCLMEFCKHLEKYDHALKPSPTIDHCSGSPSIYSNSISMESLAYPYSSKLQHFSKVVAEETRHLPSRKLREEEQDGSIRSVMQNFRTSSKCNMSQHADDQGQNYPTIKKLQAMCNLASSVENSVPSTAGDAQPSLKNVLQSMGETNTFHCASQNFFYSSLLLEACQCWEADRNSKYNATCAKLSHSISSDADQELNGSCQLVNEWTKHSRKDACISHQEINFHGSSPISLVSRKKFGKIDVSKAHNKSTPCDRGVVLLEDNKLTVNQLPSMGHSRSSKKQQRGLRTPNLSIATKTEELLKIYLCSRSNMCNDIVLDNGKERKLTTENFASVTSKTNLVFSETEVQNMKMLDKTVEASRSKLSRIPELVPFTSECLKNTRDVWSARSNEESAGDDEEDLKLYTDEVLNTAAPLSMAGLLCRLNISPEHSDGSQLEFTKNCPASQLDIHQHCYLCAIQFSSLLDLQHHILLHHTTRGAHGKVRD